MYRKPRSSAVRSRRSLRGAILRTLIVALVVSLTLIQPAYAANPAARVKDINTGANPTLGAPPSQLTAVGSTLFFVADDGVSGAELWKSDGTAAGTTMVKDIFVGAGSASIASLTD